MQDRSWILTTCLILALTAATIAAGRKLEEQPRFCVSCHEMGGYYAQWVESGASKNHPNCIICHAGPSIVGVVEGQGRGLRYIWMHYTGSARSLTPPFKVRMPADFCAKCHVAPERLDAHRNVVIAGRECQACHSHKPGRDFAGEAPRGR